jgi:hypothetical protein
MLKLIGSAENSMLRGSDGREMPGKISGVDLSYKVSGNRLCIGEPNCFPETMSRFSWDRLFFFHPEAIYQEPSWFAHWVED